MLCPYCQQEMTLGYIQSRDGLGWNQKRRFVAALSGIIADVPLGTSPVAYRCAACGKIILDESLAEDAP